MEALIESAKIRVEADYRIRAYLRCCGISDEKALARLAQKIIDAAAQGKNNEDIEKAAIEKIFRCKQEWFSFLNRNSKSGDPFAGWYLRAILQKNPDLFLSKPDLNLIDDDIKNLQLFAVPVFHQGEMPAQQLGKIPAGFQKEFWIKAASHLKSTWKKLLR